MSGSLLTSQAEEQVALWRDYWSSRWHHPVLWPKHRLSCFITAELARNDVSDNGDPLVSDFPRGRRPFLGILTNSGSGGTSPVSGALEYNDDGHLLTIAPTRSGKGAAQIIPNLLLYAGSCLVIDIKGENHKVTHKHRQTFFDGASVLKFAPFDDDTNHYNPLDFIRVKEDGSPSSYTFDDARLLSEMLVGSRANETFWDIEARNLLTMLLLYVATRYQPGHYDRVMGRVVELLFPVLSPDDDDTTSPFVKTTDAIKLWADQCNDKILGAMVTQSIEHEDKVRAGILSTCRSAMSIWLSERLQNATQESDFRFSDLKRSMCRPENDDPAPTTLYVMIPAEYLKEYRSVLRMIVGLAAVEMTRSNDWSDPAHVEAGWRTKPPCPVLFLLDEFPSLGHMAPIEQGMAYLAGYGVQIWTFAQSLGQLKEIYKENWSTFVSNAGASCYFGMADPDICDFLSQQLGKTGEYAMRYFTASGSQSYTLGSSSSDTSGSSRNHSWGSGGGGMGNTVGTSDGTSASESRSKTFAEQIRYKDDPVATSSDLRAMPQGSQIVLLRHKLPAIASLLPFYECELFTSLYDTWRP
ncbi:type IV secretory system conjugative DNA transfer family protein [Rhizobium sp. PP-CC-3G-465]|uniref:type IV secretory system conjugative DNA transfer family protein n=1 Tax=Rhizobium sp. PP-CC-3G-465 TaxID=2135648 RepID=UPI0010448E2F|nr:type IV secretory pathway TraG/TraD family ATPase VirD4 [Rhizobium sp. PP-CC-3G-465]